MRSLCAHPRATVGCNWSCRLQSTSTMDLVSLDETRSKSTSIYSTLQLKAERDFSSAASTRTEIFSEQWDALVSAAASLQNGTFEAHEMDLVEAAERRHLYDMILLLVNHGEDESQIPGLEEATDSLTGRGVGQALNLSRRTATFCNKEIGLMPDLVVVGASRKVLQTTFLTFPYDTPYHSINATPWICHPYASSGKQEGIKYSTLAELQREFTGIDCSLCFDKQHEVAMSNSSNERLLEHATDFLDWLEEREERVVVVSGDSVWLQAFGCALDYSGAACEFSNGEMRVVGVRFG
jgi:hypothetical protein